MLKGISFINTRKRIGPKIEPLEVTVDWRSSSHLHEHIGFYLAVRFDVNHFTLRSLAP